MATRSQGKEGAMQQDVRKQQEDEAIAQWKEIAE